MSREENESQAPAKEKSAPAIESKPKRPERQPVKLTGDRLPYLYDIEFKKNIKYPRFSYYAAEAFFHLFKNRYLAENNATLPVCFGYGGAAWEPFSILFTPGAPNEEQEISDDAFEPDTYEALTEFFDDLENISDDPDMSIFENEKNCFILQTCSPLSLFKLLNRYVEAYGVTTKIHSSLCFQSIADEGYKGQEAEGRLKAQFDLVSQMGLELYDYEPSADTPMGNFSLRLCENRPYISMKALGVSIAVSNELAILISMDELKAILQEETGQAFKKLSGYNLTN